MGANVQFINNSVKVKKALNDKGVAWLYEACGELEARTKRNSKVVTGKTKGSYQHNVDENNLEGFVGSNYENAIWEEFGTGEYALNGNGRKGGWFYKDAQGKGHFTHGKHPKRPLFKAFTSLKGSLIQRAQEIFGGS
ncbi:HK97 gp10 family phage protein [Parablautia muri]|uniref:HK97 gp10 family phage protein n=1 Tax=Parablautia muri TaxID=2320879 RepID=A0A9X5GSM3_9FIRM|nr:HK97 gp10 family phage protein [Parablautia muri]NBJ93206.1 HK97 gp10 family phage protein [Parablautia muri]